MSSVDSSSVGGSPLGSPWQPTMILPDNRCCFCLTLRSGSVIVGIVNAVVNALGFGWYATSPSIQSSWSHPTHVTDLDVSVFVMFLMLTTVDVLLVFGAMRKMPTLTVPWLCTNAIVMGIMLVMVALMLFFGYARMTLEYDEYVSILSLIGCLAAGHLFSCLVVFQYRKNLIETRYIYVAQAQHPEAGSIGDVHSHQHTTRSHARAPSPPPTYEEVAKKEAKNKGRKGSANKAKDVPDYEAESPPEYTSAMAALAEQEARKVHASKKPGSLAKFRLQLSSLLRRFVPLLKRKKTVRHHPLLRKMILLRVRQLPALRRLPLRLPLKILPSAKYDK